MKATGKKFSIQSSSIVELTEDKINWNTDYDNISSLLTKVGWLPGKLKSNPVWQVYDRSNIPYHFPIATTKVSTKQIKFIVKYT